VSTPALDLAPAAPAAVPVDGVSAGTRTRRPLARWITRIATVLVSLGALALLLRRVEREGKARVQLATDFPFVASRV